MVFWCEIEFTQGCESEKKGVDIDQAITMRKRSNRMVLMKDRLWSSESGGSGVVETAETGEGLKKRKRTEDVEFESSACKKRKD